MTLVRVKNQVSDRRSRGGPKVMTFREDSLCDETDFEPENRHCQLLSLDLTSIMTKHRQVLNQEILFFPPPLYFLFRCCIL